MARPIILAAGKGTRMKSLVPKALVEVAGKPMLKHLLDTLHDAHFLDPIVVVGHESKQIRARYPSLSYIEQKVLDGTAGAVEAALNYASHKYVLVLYADNPFVRVETLLKIKEMLKADESKSPKLTMLVGAVEVPHFYDEYEPFKAFGRVLLDFAYRPQRIVESKDLAWFDRDVKLLNAGLCVIERKWLQSAIKKITPSRNGERCLTQLVEMAHVEGCMIDMIKLEPREAFGVNSMDDKMILEHLFKEKM